MDWHHRELDRDGQEKPPLAAAATNGRYRCCEPATVRHPDGNRNTIAHNSISRLLAPGSVHRDSRFTIRDSQLVRAYVVAFPISRIPSFSVPDMPDSQSWYMST
ncbi:hypothetical protein MMC07_009561, partial [Pseudocyphellaria aurata]|nr:hypothetical protein [Pseudocyphellaria aurata]